MSHSTIIRKNFYTNSSNNPSWLCFSGVSVRNQWIWKNFNIPISATQKKHCAFGARWFKAIGGSRRGKYGFMGKCYVRSRWTLVFLDGFCQNNLSSLVIIWGYSYHSTYVMFTFSLVFARVFYRVLDFMFVKKPFIAHKCLVRARGGLLSEFLGDHILSYFKILK